MEIKLELAHSDLLRGKPRAEVRDQRQPFQPNFPHCRHVNNFKRSFETGCTTHAFFIDCPHFSMIGVHLWLMFSA